MHIFSTKQLAGMAYEAYNARRDAGNKDLRDLLVLIEYNDCPMPLLAKEKIPEAWKKAVADLCSNLMGLERWNDGMK